MILKTTNIQKTKVTMGLYVYPLPIAYYRYCGIWVDSLTMYLSLTLCSKKVTKTRVPTP